MPWGWLTTFHGLGTRCISIIWFVVLVRPCDSEVRRSADAYPDLTAINSHYLNFDVITYLDVLTFLSCKYKVGH